MKKITFSEQAQSRLKKKVGVMAIISASVAVAMLLFWFTAGTVKTAISDDTLTVRGTFHSYSVELSDADEVRLLSHFNEGKSGIFGSVTTHKTLNGNFSSAAYGDYRLDEYKNVGRYIVLKSRGNVYVFNCKSAEETEELYKTLAKRINENE